jgi:hypothetical protein
LIKIRYAELPAGLHVRTEAHGQSTIIYLLPGLSPAERRAALLRARRGADLGYGPPLPVAGVAAAGIRDRIRHTLRNGVLAFRAHPLLLVPPLVIVASATLVYIMMSAVTFTIRPPQASGPFPQPGPVLAAPGTSATAPGPSGHRAGGPTGPSTPPPGQSTAPGRGRHGRHPKPSPPPGSSPSPTPSGSATVSPTAPPTTGPPGTPPAPLPTGSPTATPSPSPSCLDIGPVGICLKL